MDKKDKALVISAVLIIALIIIILGSVFLNSFATPFAGGDKYTPWETPELQLILKPGSYALRGPMASNYSGNKSNQIFDDRDNRYIAPTTFFAKIICWFFKWKVKFSFLASLIGIILFIIYKNKYRQREYRFWVKIFSVLLHACFFVIALGGTLCVRWWGYG